MEGSDQFAEIAVPSVRSVGGCLQVEPGRSWEMGRKSPTLRTAQFIHNTPRPGPQPVAFTVEGGRVSHKSSFGISSPAEFLNQIVIPQHEEFMAGNSSVRHALLATVVAYHMYEWVHGESFTRERFDATYPDHESVRESLEAARLVANGMKHFTSKVATRRQTGFSSAFNDAFARPLVVELDGGSELSIDKMLRDMVEFWQEQESVDS